MSQCYITNLGAGLVQRSVADGKPIVFSRVCFNTEYVGKASALFFKPVEWYGENLGVVVGSQSHVSVSGVSCLCNTQLAIQCNDNSKAWKTVSVFAHLEGEDNEILFAAQSLMNGTVKNVFMMEIPICLDGAVEDFGDVMDADVADAIEGGGGGGDVPANMMTTDTNQDVSGVKQWEWDDYEGEGTEDTPQEGDRKLHTSLSLGEASQNPVAMETNEQQYTDKDGWMDGDTNALQLNASGVTMNGSFASWGRVINAAKNEQGFDSFLVTEGGGLVYIENEQVKPNSEIKVGSYAELVIDSNGKIASVRAALGSVLDISAAVYDNGSMHRVSGIVSNDAGLSFDSPITPADGQTIFIHWTRYE